MSETHLPHPEIPHSYRGTGITTKEPAGEAFFFTIWLETVLPHSETLCVCVGGGRAGGAVICGNWRMESLHNKCMWPGWERLPQDAPSPGGLFVASGLRLSLSPLRKTQRNAHNKHPAREALTIFPQTEGPCSNKHQQTLFIPKTGNLPSPIFRHPSQSKSLHLPQTAIARITGSHNSM